MPHSPDCWRIKTACYPDSRGYAGCFDRSPIPIVGEYLEIPSTTGHSWSAGLQRVSKQSWPFCSRLHAELSTAEGGACDVPTDAVGNSGRDASAGRETIRVRDSDLDPAVFDPETGVYFQAQTPKPRHQRQAADAWKASAINQRMTG